MTETDPLIGHWRRDGLSIARGRLKEDSDVHWLQGPNYFVDLRFPKTRKAWKARPMAFAGVMAATEEAIAFDHLIDLAPMGGEDKAGYSLEGNQLIERGSFKLGPLPLSFREDWRRDGRADEVREWQAVADGQTIGLAIQIDHHLGFVVRKTGKSGKGGQAGLFVDKGHGWQPQGLLINRFSKLRPADDAGLFFERRGDDLHIESPEGGLLFRPLTG